LPQPIADFTVDSILKLNTPINIQNNSDGETEWSWNFGNQTFSILESPSPIYAFEDSYTISLEVTNDFGCSDTTSRQIRAIDNLILYIPNTFSPNGDLKNDIFRISILNEAEFEVKIYNSFGERLFSTTDKTQGWDGKYKGKDLQEDTYIVTLFATDVFGRVYKKNKSFNLIR
jgi:gliding motility-associated-like protein